MQHCTVQQLSANIVISPFTLVYSTWHFPIWDIVTYKVCCSMEDDHVQCSIWDVVHPCLNLTLNLNLRPLPSKTLLRRCPPEADKRDLSRRHSSQHMYVERASKSSMSGTEQPCLTSVVSPDGACCLDCEWDL